MLCGDAQAVSQEADHLAIASLTRALQVPVRIAYLDQSGLVAGFDALGGGVSGVGAGEVEVNFLEFEEEALKRGEKGVEGALLYRASILRFLPAQERIPSPLFCTMSGKNQAVLLVAHEEETDSHLPTFLSLFPLYAGPGHYDILVR